MFVSDLGGPQRRYREGWALGASLSLGYRGTLIGQSDSTASLGAIWRRAGVETTGSLIELPRFSSFLLSRSDMWSVGKACSANHRINTDIKQTAGSSQPFPAGDDAAVSSLF